jgi:hypothetical protein
MVYISWQQRSKEIDMGIQKQIALETLIISKPDLQVGLTEIIPPGEKPSHYLNRYHAEYKVRCAFCTSHMPHNRGFTVQMEDGRVALCGKNCAAEYFGKEVADNHEQELEKQIRRATKRSIIKRTLDGIPAALKLISDELVDKERQALDPSLALFGEFRYSGIQSEITEQGRYELKEVRRRWVEQEDRFGVTQRVPIDDSKVILTVEGAAILKGGDTRSVVRFERVRKQLGQLLAVDTSEELSDVRIQRMSEARGQIIRDIQNACRFLDLCARFFTKDNVKNLSKLTKKVNTTAEKIALHKASEGFDLIITREGYVGDLIIYEDRRVSVVPVPDLTKRPNVSALLEPLSGLEPN